ncbi:uncharacterized protein PHACADRAFT_194872 [Phanerochaete carnosa HHB-10118-sp]|uniref:Reverse transcriptase Ty1/copia-type domain-containing protein n=1 Tax=Phanerochaete carnosa (strain HHB-10118-sp) TaxID=650164 RepID=K5W0I5_PHACS|nr:uncharacterized protein PHACADRAFT_194872 [Phanerochaete carnosa HHB-10118-sp]EKM57313.1 hypothetical protein PHACADRAFT_194872 [Phanerochaete carnosa HHB-10118-sp]
MSRNVVFPKTRTPPISEVPSPRLEEENVPLAQDKSSPPAEDTTPSPTSAKPTPDLTPDDIKVDAGNPSPPIRCSARSATPASINYREAAGYQVRKPKVDGDSTKAHFVAGEACFHTYTDEPQSVPEVKSRPGWSHWKTAMDAKIAQLDQLLTYELVDLPPGRKPIGCQWVFVIKQKAGGDISKYKVRLVGQGFMQKPGQNFFETYAPVCQQESLRGLVAISALYQLFIRQLDVTGAYLHAELKEEIYMVQPPEYNDGTGCVWRLRKAIYGLRQAGHAWNIKLNYELAALDFCQLSANACVYARTLNGAPIFIITHVDDMSLMTSSLTVLTTVKKQIASRLEVTDMGKIKKYIGIEFSIDRERGIYTMHQTTYLTTIIERFGMLDSKPVRMPMDPDVHLTPTPENDAPDTTFPYAAAIGSLMYAAVSTRPDIAFAVQHLSQFTAHPSAVHITAVKHIFRNVLTGYTDADWATSLVDRRSISGYVYTLAGGAISWSSLKQRSVALSSMESEYMALAHATKEAVWLRALFSDLGLLLDGPTPLLGDNQATIAFSQNNQFHKRSKHIDVRYHFTRERIISNEISVTYCASEDNQANLFTKGLSRPAHERQLARIGLRAH